MQGTYTKDNDTDLANVLRQGEDKLKGAMADAQHKVQQKQEQLKQIVSTVDKQLKENPWPIVAGVAVGGILLGFILANSRSKS